MISFAAIILIIVVAAGAVALTLQIQRLEPVRVTRATSSRPAPVLAREPENAIERMVVALKEKKVARIGLSALSFALLLGAAGVIGYPFYTNLYQGRLQGQLDRQLASPELRDAYLNRQVGEGDSLTRIKIPRIGVDVVVVEGTTASALRAGAGHYPSTPLPCEVGNVAIAGHRTTYGRPFHDLDVLQPGDRITLETPIGQCTYEVRAEPFIVRADPDRRRRQHPRRSSRSRSPPATRRVRPGSGSCVTATMVSAETFDA